MVSVVKKLLPGAAGTAGSGGGDDDFNLVGSLFHADGSNGANNHSGYVDSSSNNLTVTRTAGVYNGTFSPFSKDEGKWSVYFPKGVTTNQIYVNPASTADLSPGTSAFTVEAWVFVTADTYTYSRLFNIGPYWNSNNTVALILNDTSYSNKISFGAYAAGGNSRTCISTNATPMNEWFHVAVTRGSTGDFRLFVNGNLDSTNTSYRTTNLSSLGSQTMAIGNGLNSADEESFEGYISNFRFVKGTAVYTSSFTVPTEPLTAITNTKLLTCCSNRFRDKGPGADVTSQTSGYPQIHPFSPFKNSAKYDPAVHGASAYFPGTGNTTGYVKVDHATLFDFGTADHCLEMWLYPSETTYKTGSSQWRIIADLEGANNYWGWTNAGLGAGYNGLTNHTDTLDSNSGVDAEMPIPYSWNHIVYQFTGGRTNWYINGTRVYDATRAHTWSSNATGIRLGNSGDYNDYFYKGFATDFRVTTGTNYNPYSNAATLTVPTAPLTSGSYTRALLNFATAGLRDEAGGAVLATFGNIQVDTGTTKFGTGSMEFDGTGDYGILRDVKPLHTMPFTIEFFMKTGSVSLQGGAYRRLFTTGTSNVSTTKMELCINSGNGTGYGTTTNIFIYTGATSLIGTTAVGDNAWHHIAVTRDSSNNLRLFVDGTQSGSTTASWTNDLSQDDHMFGTYNGAIGFYAGYIDDFRITYGKARYTSNFDVPTEAFPDI